MTDRQNTRWTKFVETTHRALVEFLWLPLLIIAGFLLLAVVTSALDLADSSGLERIRAAMRERVFRNGESTGQLLATIAGSIITVTSITFSLLLLAVQQAAGTLTHQVYDQFLRRRVNQIYFGFFVGLAVYTLIVLASVNPPFNPVVGASVALLLTIIALLLTILLLYTTVNQMRPVVVIETIHDHVLRARDYQCELLARTLRSSAARETSVTPVLAEGHGYVTGIDLERLDAATRDGPADLQIVLRAPIGAHITLRDTLAEVRTASADRAAKIAADVRATFCLAQQRDLDTDPAYGIEQLAVIGWTSVSTAKSNPSPGVMVLHNLRDLLARWSEEGADAGEKQASLLPVVYPDDVFERLFDAFETLAVAASGSMQPQTMAEVLRTFDLMFDRLPDERRARAEDMIRRTLSALGEHVLTAQLSAAIDGLIRTLHSAGRNDTAREVQAAHLKLDSTIGKLGSRATRATGPA